MTVRDIRRRLNRLDTGRSIEPVEFIELRGVKPRAAVRLALGELAPSEDDDTTSYIMRMKVDPK
jgi:hypothetical protein